MKPFFIMEPSYSDFKFTDNAFSLIGKGLSN